MTTSTNDTQRQLEFQRQSRRLSRTTQKPAEQQLGHIDEDILIHKQLLKKSITEKNTDAIRNHGEKLITLFADKTSIHIHNLHKQYHDKPPKYMIEQLVTTYTKHAYTIEHIMKRHIT